VSGTFIKRRPPADPGSLPDLLGMFRNEVRFYRELAPVVGVRVPGCLRAEETADGTLLELEDLSDWRPGGDPAAIAATLAVMHRRWRGRTGQWPWLRPLGTAADEIGALYDRVWPGLAWHPVLSDRVREFGERLVGRAAAAEAGATGPPTVCHGDASYRNARTSPDGVVALLDWEDVSAVPATVDLSWLLVSSVPPAEWGAALDGYGPIDALADAMPGSALQGLLSLADEAPDSAEAAGWGARLDSAVRLIARG